MENRMLKLIDVLCELTSKSELDWNRVAKLYDDNNILHNGLKKFVKKYDDESDYLDPRLDVDESLYTRYNDGYVFVFIYEGNGDFDYELVLQKEYDSKLKIVVEMGDGNKHIKRLVNVIEDKLDNVDDFISSFF